MVFEFLRRNKKAPAVAEEYGIEVTPVPITAGETVTVKYHGDLASGGMPVILHSGYGTDRWDNVQNIPMRREPDGTWSADVTIDTNTEFSFCFTNGREWDNNDGRNWTYEVHDGLRV